MESAVLKVENLVVSYDGRRVLHGVSMEIPEGSVVAIMGPSGCGKTTLIRAMNRMHEVSGNASTEGRILLRGQDIYAMDPIEVRRRIGMVFQRPNPFPHLSIYDNVLAGYRLNGIRLSRAQADSLVEEMLRKVYLWDEVKDKLKQRGTFLSGGQQQRLCIARALAMRPEVLLLDEPTSSLDPKATAKIEELVVELKRSVTIVMVTHNTGQAARISDYTAFMYLGELVEFGPTDRLFTVPRDRRTEEYLMGKFG